MRTTRELAPASNLFNPTSKEGLERPHLLSVTLADLPLFEAVRRETGADMEETLGIMSELLPILKANPEMPLKTSTNTGEEEADFYGLRKILEEHRRKKEYKYEKYPDATDKGIAAWDLGYRLLEEANPLFNINAATEFTVKIPNEIYQNPRMYTPMMNVVTVLKIEEMMQNPELLTQFQPSARQI